MPSLRSRGLGPAAITGGVVSVAVAVFLFTRFGFHGSLSRDEAVYVYGGQQLVHGLAPYASIFDPKTPMATVVAALGALLARLLGLDDLVLVRVVYFVCSCLTVLATYRLADRLWHSRLAGVAAAVTFACFRGFAMDAGSGPDAKTPGLLLVVVCMLLLLDRSWFWAAFCGSCAFLVWQPMALYPALAVVLSVACSTGPARLRALGAAVAGAVLPVLATVACFAAAGALGPLVQATLLFPLQGIARGSQTVGGRLRQIVSVVSTYYGASGVLLWLGMVVLLALAVRALVRRPLRAALRDPVVCVVTATMLGQLGYASRDFQSYPDVFPLLPYGALGIGAGVATLLSLARTRTARNGMAVAVVAGLAAVTAYSAVSFSQDPANNDGLRGQRLHACAVDRLLPPRGGLYAVGDPTPLVLTHRRNLDPFILVSSGLREWKVAHTPGGFDGWMAQIRRADPSVVVTTRIPSDTNVALGGWLRQNGYLPAYVGRWRVYADERARERAQERGIGLRRVRTPVPTSPVASGARPLTTCG
jgi:hypothetical protein